MIEKILEEKSESAKEKLKSEFLEEVEATKFIKKIYDQKGFEYHAVQASWHKFLGNRFLPDFLLSFEAYRAEGQKVEHV